MNPNPHAYPLVCLLAKDPRAANLADGVDWRCIDCPATLRVPAGTDASRPCICRDCFQRRVIRGVVASRYDPEQLRRFERCQQSNALVRESRRVDVTPRACTSCSVEINRVMRVGALSYFAFCLQCGYAYKLVRDGSIVPATEAELVLMRRLSPSLFDALRTWMRSVRLHGPIAAADRH